MRNQLQINMVDFSSFHGLAQVSNLPCKKPHSEVAVLPHGDPRI